MDFVQLNVKDGLDYQKIKLKVLSLKQRVTSLEREWDKTG